MINDFSQNLNRFLELLFLKKRIFFINFMHYKFIHIFIRKVQNDQWNCIVCTSSLLICQIKLISYN